MAQWILNLPLWQSIRFLGIVSYLLLAAGIGFGILYSFPGLRPNTKVNLYDLHTFTTNTGMILGFLHGVITVIDPFMPFGWSEVLIPFTAQHSPFLNGLGTLAAYGLLILIFTSDFRHKLSKKVWRAIHLLSYPTFIMAFIHGYFLGTDTSIPGIHWMYILSLGAILFLTVIRFLNQPTIDRPSTQGAK